MEIQTKSNLRYFIFGAMYTLEVKKILFSSFRHERENFPSINDLKDVVISLNEKARSIAILSISEVKKDDFDKFFSGKD